jgi:hypothetical protein
MSEVHWAISQWTSRWLASKLLWLNDDTQTSPIVVRWNVDPVNSTDNRKIGSGMVFLSGLVTGVIVYLVAEGFTPKSVASPGDHDILLANRLGFIYTTKVGLWLGWLQRSWRRAFVGVVVSIGIGFAYMGLRASRNFFAVMVGFPCLLGGVLAAIAGSNRSPWLKGFGLRLGKGLIAGLVLGFTYMVIRNTSGAMFMPSGDGADYTQAYLKMMWRDGPVALGISSALFFVLIKWAVGLSRVKLLVFEEPPAPAKTISAEPDAVKPPNKSP